MPKIAQRPSTPALGHRLSVHPETVKPAKLNFILKKTGDQRRSYVYPWHPKQSPGKVFKRTHTQCPAQASIDQACNAQSLESPKGQKWARRQQKWISEMKTVAAPTIRRHTHFAAISCRTPCVHFSSISLINMAEKWMRSFFHAKRALAIFPAILREENGGKLDVEVHSKLTQPCPPESIRS